MEMEDVFDARMISGFKTASRVEKSRC
jgi:hypothetical protein